MQTKTLNTVPSVQKFTVGEKCHRLPEHVKINFGKTGNRFAFFLNDWISYEETEGEADIELKYDAKIKAQGYKIDVTDSILIQYSDECGIFYAFTTLRQLADSCANVLPELSIEDWPDIAQRGVMLDVSRGRMQSIETVKNIVDWLAALKYNQLQLYFDAIVYDYEGLEQYTAGHVVYSRDEIKGLSDYCAERFIELVPNQNSFGHMGAWTCKPELSDLAITKDNGKKLATLNPLKQESIDFVDRLYGGMLPAFNSGYLNIGCDETELGVGDVKAECDRIGSDKVYLNYLLKLYELVKGKYKLTPMFWDDIAMNHPDLIPQLPKDMVVMEWGYESYHPFEEHCRMLKEMGLRFYVCPGTSAWNSFSGKTLNMLENLRKATKYAVIYGAEGCLLTDWGDCGQVQPLAVSIPPYVIGAMYSWHEESREASSRTGVIKRACAYANRYIFHTEDDVFGWIIRIGKFCHLEAQRPGNSTMLWNNLLSRNPENYPLVYHYVSLLAQELDSFSISGKNKEYLLDELKNICRLICLMSDPDHAAEKLNEWQQEYERLWDLRSKHDPLGYGIVTGHVNAFVRRAEEMKKNNEKIPTAKTDICWYTDKI